MIEQLKVPRSASGPQTGLLLEKVAQLHDQLELLRAQVRQAQQLASMGTVAATIAHECSNLLTPVLNYAEVGLSTDDEKTKRKALEIAVRHIKILKASTDRLLGLTGTKCTDPDMVSVRQAAEDAAEGQVRPFEKDGITFQLDDVEPSLHVWCDPLQLRQILFNLFLNARQALKRGRSGILKVAGDLDGDRVVLRVNDTGGGIPEAILSHVFETFTSSKPADSTGLVRCSGLGLSLCRDLVTENGGTIEVASEQGVGTTFTITLPARRPGSPS